MTARVRITSPFGYRSTALEVVAGHDLRGKTAIVTGAASGIGVETARALAQAGATLVLPVRDRAKGDALAAELRAETNNATVEIGSLDLGDMASVRAFAADFLSRHDKLHILINNAGIMATPLARTREGWESQIATCHLGHMLLTVLLAPALRKAAPARVVSLSSIGHAISDILWDDIMFETTAYDPWRAYGQAKTANALFAVGVTQKLGQDGVTSNSVMPGGIMTGLQKHMTTDEMKQRGWIKPDGTFNEGFKTPAQGASTSVWAALGPELDGIGGLYLEDCAEAVPFTTEPTRRGVLPRAIDAGNSERLWGMSEKLLGVTL